MKQARRLAMVMRAPGTAHALAAALPLQTGVPFEMAALLVDLDRKCGGS